MANQNILVYLTVCLSVIAVLTVLYLRDLGFLPSVSARQDLVAVLPGVFIVFLGMWSASAVKRSPAIVGATASIGLGVALLLSEMDSAGLIAVGGFGDWTLYQVQFICLLGGFILGAIIYFRR